MTHQDPHSGEPISNLLAVQSDAMAKRIDAMIQLQSEMFDTLEGFTRAWLARAKTETRRVSELSTKLAAARSLPEGTTAYQEWLSEGMQLMTDDNRRIVADGQRFMQSGMRLLGNGHAPAN